MVLLIFKGIKIWFLKNILIVSQEKGLNNNFFLFCEFFISFNNEINKNFVFNKKKHNETTIFRSRYMYLHLIKVK